MLSLLRNEFRAVASDDPIPNADHVYVTGRGDDTSYCKEKTLQESIFNGPFPLVMLGAEGIAGAPAATPTTAAKDESPLADFKVLSCKETVWRGTRAGSLPKVALRNKLVSNTQLLSVPNFDASSTRLQGKTPAMQPPLELHPESVAWLIVMSRPLPVEVKSAEVIDGARQ